MKPFCWGFGALREGYGGTEAAGDKCHPVNCWFLAESLFSFASVMLTLTASHTTEADEAETCCNSEYLQMQVSIVGSVCKADATSFQNDCTYCFCVCVCVWDGLLFNCENPVWKWDWHKYIVFTEVTYSHEGSDGNSLVPGSPCVWY